MLEQQQSLLHMMEQQARPTQIILPGPMLPDMLLHQQQPQACQQAMLQSVTGWQQYACVPQHVQQGVLETLQQQQLLAVPPAMLQHVLQLQMLQSQLTALPGIVHAAEYQAAEKAFQTTTVEGAEQSTVHQGTANMADSKPVAAQQQNQQDLALSVAVGQQTSVSPGQEALYRPALEPMMQGGHGLLLDSLSFPIEQLGKAICWQKQSVLLWVQYLCIHSNVVGMFVGAFDETDQGILCAALSAGLWRGS